MRACALLSGLLALGISPLWAQEVTLYLMDVPPYAMDTPQRKGMLGDVTLEAARRAGYQPKIVVVPSPRALLEVPKLEDVLIIPLARLKDREPHYTWIAHIFDVERAFYTRDKKMDSFEQARASLQTIGVARGSAGYLILLEQGFSKAQLVEINQGVSAPKMLALGRIDAWYNPVLEAEKLQAEIGKERFVMGKPLGVTGQYLACSKLCKPELVTRLSNAVKEMQRDGTAKKLISAYLTP
jgi:polar amino acid transport system substrate-binding protein